MSGSAGELKQS